VSTVPSFSVPTKVITGLGSLKEINSAILQLNGKRIAVVVDAGIHDSGMLDGLLAQAPGLAPVLISVINPDPDVAAVEEAASAARQERIDLILAIGGGSALGVGKAVGVRLTNDESIDSYEGRGIVPNVPAPTIAIPTTAGSGSEVSNALVLHEPGRTQELVIRGPGCEPRIAILDGIVLRGLPKTPMLHSSFDALSHAMDALWSRGSTFFTDGLALHAAKTIVQLLPLAVAGIASGKNSSGENDRVLQGLLEASSAANIACGNSGLSLVHALSTSPSVRIPHGLQNAVLLPHVAKFNSAFLPEEAVQLLPLIDRLYAELEFEPSFEAVEEGKAVAESMIEASRGHPFRVNNRRASTDAELAEILVAAGAVFMEGPDEKETN
jgi:alcohol dehydrogenase class IV